MRIDSSVIGMESARRYTSSKTQYNRFVLKDYHDGKTQANTSFLGEDVGTENTEGKDSPQKSSDVKEYAADLQDRVERMRSRVKIRTVSDDFSDRFREYTTRYIFMLLFGEDKTNDFLGEREEIDLSASKENQATLEMAPMKMMSLTAETYYEEREEVSFSSTGKVTTADGREITFSVEVGMSRSFSQYYRQEYNIAQFQQVCDPLVINFEQDVASLSDQKFFFDIDADGEKDEVSLLGSGSGYLALDKNEDGIINDGNELFGPQSGNGFADLAQYDEDGNGWIDENDTIWNKLKVWCKDESGKDILYTLREKEIGAICLQSAETNFALNNASNVSNGFLRRTGIFLYENGTAGTLQHLDLVQ